jgi:hypothetical protein
MGTFPIFFVLPVSDFGLFLPSLYEFIHINLFFSVGRTYVHQARTTKSKMKIQLCLDVSLCYWIIEGQYVLDLSRIY